MEGWFVVPCCELHLLVICLIRMLTISWNVKTLWWHCSYILDLTAKRLFGTPGIVVQSEGRFSDDSLFLSWLYHILLSLRLFIALYAWLILLWNSAIIYYSRNHHEDECMHVQCVTELMLISPITAISKNISKISNSQLKYNHYLCSLTLNFLSCIRHFITLSWLIKLIFTCHIRLNIFPQKCFTG